MDITYCFLSRPDMQYSNAYDTQMHNVHENTMNDLYRNHSSACFFQINSISSHLSSTSELTYLLSLHPSVNLKVVYQP